MENREVVYNLLLLAATIVILLVTGGGVAAVIQLLRTRKQDVERAYLSLPPEVQAEITKFMQTAATVLNAVNGIFKYLGEVTDGDLETEADAKALLAKAERYRAMASSRLLELQAGDKPKS